MLHEKLKLLSVCVVCCVCMCVVCPLRRMFLKNLMKNLQKGKIELNFEDGIIYGVMDLKISH